MTKEQIYKIVATEVTALLTCLAIGLGLSSCNVTLTVTTKSECWQRGLSAQRFEYAAEGIEEAEKEDEEPWGVTDGNHEGVVGVVVLLNTSGTGWRIGCVLLLSGTIGMAAGVNLVHHRREMSRSQCRALYSCRLLA